MNSIVLVFAAVVAIAHGSLPAYNIAPLSRTTILDGPSSSAHLVGNDGSQILAHAPGARIAATENLGGAAVAYSAPLLAPAVLAHQAVLPHGGPILALPTAYAAYPAWARGSGIEGQYIPDYTEKLFDDGSYKGEIY